MRVPEQVPVRLPRPPVHCNVIRVPSPSGSASRAPGLSPPAGFRSPAGQLLVPHKGGFWSARGHGLVRTRPRSGPHAASFCSTPVDLSNSFQATGPRSAPQLRHRRRPCVTACRIAAVVPDSVAPAPARMVSPPDAGATTAPSPGPRRPPGQPPCFAKTASDQASARPRACPRAVAVRTSKLLRHAR